MRIPRLLFRRILVWVSVLVASLLVLLWAAPVAAQADRSSQNPPAVSWQAPPISSQAAAPRSQIQLPDHFRGQAQNLSRPDLHSIAPRKLRPVKLPAQSPPVLLARNLEIGSNLRIRNNNERCYTVREYRYQRDDPTSDATTFKDYEACQPAAEFRLRAAVAQPVRPSPLPNARTSPALPHCGFAYGNACPAMVPAGPPITH